MKDPGLHLEDLTIENLLLAPEWDAPPYSCKFCLCWEHLQGNTSFSEGGAAEALRQKIARIRATRKVFGNCGRIAFLDGMSVGYAQYAPPDFLPNSREYPAGPPSTDSVLLACLFVPHREFQRRNIGQHLLTAILNELVERGIPAVETFACRDGWENPSGSIDFYRKHGFTVVRDDAYPLLRRELKSGVEKNPLAGAIPG